jgi:hypothetical protein
MKTYAPKHLTGSMLRELLDLHHATPAQAAKYLRVTERSVWRWLSDGSAPYAVLAALWLESPRGREVAALDVGNELVIVRGSARIAKDAQAVQSAQLARVLAISETGAANDPVMSGPFRAQGSLSIMARIQAAPPAALALAFCSLDSLTCRTGD